MNYQFIRYNLEEIEEELALLLKKLRFKQEVPEAELGRAVRHITHHINIAWNARKASQTDVDRASQSDLEAWAQYPKDLGLMKF
ncbi:MAG: hypothetical protein P4M08_09665 [Oligoflexia bacterium]|nr:hypothetical protein [Oligoflexia bacterium]